LGINITFVCQNCLDLRQCLHPESAKKSIISLSKYYWSYFDLRLEFEHKYKTSECKNLNAMLESNYIKTIDLNIKKMKYDITFFLYRIKYISYI